jgi:hypothetical protein
MSHENKELTKKVLNALDPKYILSQDQQSKVTAVFKRFRDKEEENKEALEDLASAGLDRLSNRNKTQKKSFLQRLGMNKESRERRAQEARQTKRLGDRYDRQRKPTGPIVPLGDYERKKKYTPTINPLGNYRFPLRKTPPEPRTILQRIGMNKDSREKRATRRAQKAENEKKFLRNQAERAIVTPEEAARRRKMLFGDLNQPTGTLPTKEQQEKDELLRRAWKL